MDVTNNSTIDSVIDFANAKFGMELTKDQISSQLRELSFAETLKLLNSIKQDDNDAFSQIIDLSAVSEGYKIMPPMDPKYVERDGLEGPFTALSGKVVYYDPKEGKYYDPDTDIYMSYDEWQEHNNDHRGMKDERDEVPEARSSASDQAAKAGAYNGGKSLAGKGDGKAHLAHKLKGDALQKHRDAGVAKMDAEDEKARAAQRAKFDAMKKENNEQINEIDPSRSPWTQNGKHPGAMDADELRNELEVFNELRDRGDYLSPRELAQEDSLFDYLEQIDGPQVDWENESVVDNQTNEASDELARLIQLSRHGIESIPEAYGTISSAQPSRATIRAGDTQNKTANRRANNINQDMNRDAKVSRLGANGVPGYKNPNPTGTGASRAGSADPDDIHRSEIEQVARGGQDQSLTNAQEIERLKQLAMGG